MLSEKWAVRSWADANSKWLRALRLFPSSIEDKAISGPDLIVRAELLKFEDFEKNLTKFLRTWSLFLSIVDPFGQIAVKSRASGVYKFMEGEINETRQSVVGWW